MMHSFLGVLMAVLMGGGGNDLLDYLPTDAYWKAKGVTVTVERLTGELATAEPADVPALIRDLGAKDFQAREAATRKLAALGPAAAPALKEAAESDDPEVRTRARNLLAKLGGSAQAKAVRRLMAIRTLGELKKPEALAALRPLLASKELFVADYARQAIAAIEGKPYTRPEPPKDALWQDIALLPKRCGVVAQAAMPPGGPVAFDKLLKDTGKMFPPGRDVGQMLDQMTKMILMVAERIGNVRVHRVTLGVAEDVGGETGFAVIVVRGLYDAEAARAALRQLGMNSSKVDGAEVFSPEDKIRLIPCANDLFVFAGGPKEEQIPMAEVVAAIKSRSAQPALDPKMLALVKSLDISSPLWAVTRMSETYRRAPLLAPLDTLVLTSKLDQSGMLLLKLVARGKDAAGVQRATEQFKAGLKEALDEIKKEVARAGFLKPIVAFLESVRVEGDGATATVTGKLKGTSAVLMAPMFLFMGRAARVENAREAVMEDIEVGPEKVAPKEVAPAPRKKVAP